MMIIPIHLENHWVLSVIYSEGHWGILDSLANESSVVEAKEILQSWLEKSFPMKDWFYLFPIRTAHQQLPVDRSNCGPYICAYAEELCLKKSMMQISKNPQTKEKN